MSCCKRQPFDARPIIHLITIEHPPKVLTIDRHALRLPRLAPKTDTRLHLNVVLAVRTAADENRIPGGSRIKASLDARSIPRMIPVDVPCPTQSGAGQDEKYEG